MNTKTPYLNVVYDKLTTGHFICSNSIDDSERQVFRNVEDNFDEYKAYFAQIGLFLESGNGYFYFSRIDTAANIRKKLLKFSEWILIEDFLLTVDACFGVGYRFRISQFENRISEDSECKRKLRDCYELKKKQKENCSDRERLEKICDCLRSDGYIEEISAEDAEYQVTTAFDYLMKINELINVKYEEENENAGENGAD